ncbi:MAG: RnfH family protein [Burkholderiaceae bacterium]
MKVEVAYSPSARAVDLCLVELPEGAKVADAIEASGLLDRHPALRAAPAACGVWGRACRPDRALADGDRVELYRPLAVDPKDARRSRGREEKQAKTAARRRRVSGSSSA